MDTLTLAGALGLFGAALYVIAYAAMQFGLVRGQTYAYAGMNLIAACCVLYSLMETYNLSSVLIQIMWIVISLIGIMRLWFVDRTMRFSEEEQHLLTALAPGLPKDHARKLLDIGEWRVLRSDSPVIEEGVPVPFLGWLGDGMLVVSKGGVPIRSLGPGAVIGEMTYLDGAPATARIDVRETARLFCIDAKTLRALIERNSVIANALEYSVARSLRGKLQETSQELRDHMSGFAEQK